MLSKIDTVVFDKTGTLTLGTPHVADAFVVDGAVSWAEFAQILYAVESRSEHPIAHAVAEYALNILAEEGVYLLHVLLCAVHAQISLFLLMMMIMVGHGNEAIRTIFPFLTHVNAPKQVSK